MKIKQVMAPVVPAEADRLAATIKLYENVFEQAAGGRFTNTEGTLDVVIVGSTVIVSGTPEMLARRRELKATLLVDSLDDWQAEMDRVGATVVEAPSPGPVAGGKPVGRFMIVRQADGSLFEYLQLGA